MSGLAFSAFASPIFPTESIASYLSHALVFAGDNAQNSYATGKNHHQAGRTSHLLPSRLRGLADSLAGGLTDITSLLDQNTMFPAMRLSLSVDDVGVLKSHFCDAPVPGIGTITGIAYRTLRRGWDVGICRDCFNEDLRDIGRSFLRREWALATLAVCTKHKSTLWKLCNECRHGIRVTRNLGLLQNRCLCGSNLKERFRFVDSRDIDGEVRIARSLNMLTGMGSNHEIDSRHTYHVLRKRAKELSLIGNRGVKTRDLENFAKEVLGDASIARHKLHWGAGGAVVRMLGRRGNYLRNPLHHSLLVAVLFGRPETYVHEVAAARMLSDEELDSLPQRHQVSRRGASNRCPPVSVELYRQKALKCLGESPCASRREIKFELGKYGYGVLYKHSRKFVEAHFPPPSRGPHEPKRITERQLAYDAEFASEVRGRRAAFGDKLPPYRLSRQRLTEGVRNASIFNAIKKRLPLTVQALDECTETTEEYAQRIGRRRKDLSSGREEKS
ncbi:hypothetical protein [Burkholderia sp. L27(2015)]|uniref:hypothetical protein n=1 Tax=Burkholderia sp. L27(2015) TaxID=1641858 RepID=UPI00131C3010|nr:hypothetical protein [Burkholderia sp. L27(2015)]